MRDDLKYNPKGKRITVVGMARSGIASARVLNSLDAEVMLCDMKPAPELPDIPKEELAQKGIKLHFGGHPEEWFRDVDLIVLSPGVPFDLEEFSRARGRSILTVSEVELAWMLWPLRIAGITGTNGKSTTTQLAHDIFLESGAKVTLGGNIGIPLVQVASEVDAETLIVTELSSFQLEATIQFHPGAAALLNITPDHLYRHGTMDRYALAKKIIFQNQTENDVAVLNYDDEIVRAMAESVKSRIEFFSRVEALAHGAYLSAGEIVFQDNGDRIKILPAKKLRTPGGHNVENALAATALTAAMGVEPEVIGRALESFRGLPHRLEDLGTVRGVKFINDSKATNTASTLRALDSFQEPIVVILGGYDKGEDFGALASRVARTAKRAVLLGQTANLIEAALRREAYDRYERAADLDEVVSKALEAAEPGDVALFSPACASFDMFKDFEDRGWAFRLAVEELRGSVE